MWVRIHPEWITLSKKARECFYGSHSMPPYRKVRLFWDRDAQLFGFKPSATGYTITKYGRLRCRLIPEEVPRGKFHAAWDNELGMLITSFVPV